MFFPSFPINIFAYEIAIFITIAVLLTYRTELVVMVIWKLDLQLPMQSKKVHSTRSASDKVYQLLAYGRWFSPGTPASSTTKTGRHDIAEILLKVALNTKSQSIMHYVYFMNIIVQHDLFHCLWKTFLVMFHLNNNKNKDKYITF